MPTIPVKIRLRLNVTRAASPYEQPGAFGVALIGYNREASLRKNDIVSALARRRRCGMQLLRRHKS